MTFTKSATALALMLALQACSSRTFDIGTEQITASVPVETVVTVKKGELLYAESNGTMVAGAELLAPVKARTVLTYHEVPAGEALVRRVSEGEAFFCTQRKTHIDPITGPFNFSCLRDIDEDEKFDEIYVYNDDLSLKRDVEAVPYRPKQIENTGAHSTQLFFSGVRNNQLIITQKLVDPGTSEVFDEAEYCFSDIANDPRIQIPLVPYFNEFLTKHGIAMVMEVQSVSDEQVSVKIVRGFPSWSLSGTNFKGMEQTTKNKSCL